MKTYAALGADTSFHIGALNTAGYDRVLVSYHYDRRATFLRKIDHPFLLMVDSGAYSVRSVGAEIVLDDYIAWAKAYAVKHPTMRVTNLDVIPGSPGVLPTKRERSQAMEKSVENATAIRQAGLRVVEVFHLFDDFAFLEPMVERRREGEVIGVAGLGGAGANKKVGAGFGSAVFARLRDLCGWDHFPPVHGFGVSASNIGFRYPLASIDASTWVATRRFGQKPDRFGKFSGGSRSDASLRSAEIAAEYSARLLRQWKTREVQIAEFWRERGVTIEEEGVASVHG